MQIMRRLTAWVAMLGMPAVAWALAVTVRTLWNGRGAVAQVDDLVAMGAAGIGAAVAGYLTATGWAMLAGALLRGGRSLPRPVAVLAPVSWQRITAIALGLGMSAGFGASALASQPSAPHVGWSEPVAGQSSTPAPDPSYASSSLGRLPVAASTPPTDGGARDVGFAPAPSATPLATSPTTATGGTAVGESSDAARTYTVMPGDSLWRIAATLLGSAASDVSVSRAWPELYAANADAVGADPGLIHPGLVLTVPKGFPS